VTPKRLTQRDKKAYVATGPRGLQAVATPTGPTEEHVCLHTAWFWDEIVCSVCIVAVNEPKQQGALFTKTILTLSTAEIGSLNEMFDFRAQSLHLETCTYFLKWHPLC